MDQEFTKRLSTDRNVQRLESRIKAGKGSMRDAGELGGIAGRIASRLAGERLQKEFPEAKIPEEEVRRIFSPILKQMHTYVAGMTAIIIDEMYEEAGIGLKASSPEYDTSRENEIVKEVSARSFEDGFY